jgi:hypothetical protein
VFGAVVYSLCLFTSATCAWLLLSSYRRQRERLLLWSGLSFCLLAMNSALVFIDIIVLPAIDLMPLRQATSLLAVSVLLYGFIWEAD